MTTYLMFTDEARPPSSRKRAHQWLKWATGGALALVAAFHALCPVGQLAPALLAVLAAPLWHAYVGCKSLVRDLGLPHRRGGPLQRAGGNVPWRRARAHPFALEGSCDLRRVYTSGCIYVTRR